MPSTIQPEQDEKTKNMTTQSIGNSIGRPPLRRGLPRKQQRRRTQAMWIIRGFLLLPLTLVWLAFSPKAQAVCQEGCLTNNNPALGEDALLNNTGQGNTANGAF